MIDSPSIALAFAAGFVSSVSPCCLPLVPGYLATVSGIDVTDVGRRVDARVLGRSLAFVATFSTVFILLGLAATTLGSFPFENQPVLNTVAGAVGFTIAPYLFNFQVLGRLFFEWFKEGPNQLFELFVHAVYGLLPVPSFASALAPRESTEPRRSPLARTARGAA